MSTVDKTFAGPQAISTIRLKASLSRLYIDQVYLESAQHLAVPRPGYSEILIQKSNQQQPEPVVFNATGRH